MDKPMGSPDHSGIEKGLPQGHRFFVAGYQVLAVSPLGDVVCHDVTGHEKDALIAHGRKDQGDADKTGIRENCGIFIDAILFFQQHMDDERADGNRQKRRQRRP